MQGVGRVGQIHDIAHLRPGEAQEVSGGIGRCHGRAERPCAVGHAQGLVRHDKHKVLVCLHAEAERNEHGVPAEVRHKARAGPPGRIAVQAGQHVFHALHRGGIPFQIIAPGERGRHFAAGEVFVGDAGHAFLTGMPGRPCRG